jgi:hypothetical protein
MALIPMGCSWHPTAGSTARLTCTRCQNSTSPVWATHQSSSHKHAVTSANMYEHTPGCWRLLNNTCSTRGHGSHVGAARVIQRAVPPDSHVHAAKTTGPHIYSKGTNMPASPQKPHLGVGVGGTLPPQDGIDPMPVQLGSFSKSTITRLHVSAAKTIHQSTQSNSL